MDAVSYIQHWEGFRPRLYLCPARYPTIGFGTRVATWKAADLVCRAELAAVMANDTGDWITREQATALMLPAVAASRAACIKTFGATAWSKVGDDPTWLTAWMLDSEAAAKLTVRDSPRQIALTDLAYNMGGFSKFPRFVEAVVAGRWKSAHDELLWARGSMRTGSAMADRSAYYRQPGRRAECNAKVLLSGELPEVLP